MSKPFDYDALTAAISSNLEEQIGLEHVKFGHTFEGATVSVIGGNIDANEWKETGEDLAAFLEREGFGVYEIAAFGRGSVQLSRVEGEPKS